MLMMSVVDDANAEAWNHAQTMVDEYGFYSEGVWSRQHRMYGGSVVELNSELCLVCGWAPWKISISVGIIPNL